MSQTLESLYPEWSGTEVQLFRNHFGKRYEEVFLDSKPYHDADRVMQRLGNCVSVVTNKPKRWAAPLLKRLEWEPLSLHCASGRLDRKPAPHLIENAVERLRKQHGLREVISVGDSVSDYRASVAAGLSFIKVGWSKQEMPAEQEIPNWTWFAEHKL